VALAEVLQEYSEVLALTFYYGQRAWEQEKVATNRIAQHYGIAHEVVELPWLANLLPQALMPKEKLLSPEVPVTDENLFETARVWVPNRNGVFLNIAASFAEATGASAVMFGANADEAAGFPDNTQKYRDKMTEAFAFSTLNHVVVKTPVGHLSKAQIIERAKVLNVPLHFIWSCYEGESRHCGQCPSCLLLKKAIEVTEQPSPVLFAS
jgi:7-cyano-7-deazaguanine synthase